MSREYGDIDGIPPCSVVLCNGNSNFSKIIRAFSTNHKRDTFTHAGLYLGNSDSMKHVLCHEVGAGTTLQPIEEEIKSCLDVSVWYNTNMSDEVKHMIKWVAYGISKQYDKREILSIGLPVKRGDGLICTELVLKVFKMSGFSILGDKTEKVFPNELRDKFNANREWKEVYRYER